MFLSVQEQNRVANAARKVGGYDNLIKLERKRRFCKRNNITFDLRQELEHMSQV